MEFFAKTFDELTTKELYEILKSRSQIFTIEQNIHCQDMDDIDYNSLHCYITVSYTHLTLPTICSV